MNRRKKGPREIGFGSVLILLVTALVMAAGGVFHAYIKNRQINVSREIKRVEDRIAEHQLDVEAQAMVLAKLNNRFLIRDRLINLGSELIPIKEVIELELHDPGMQLAEQLPDQPATAESSVVELSRPAVTTQPSTISTSSASSSSAIASGP